jgi:DNA replication ATP-dependent helicase Dna2
VDESSQIALPVSIGPIQFADKFILVGDHYQLPPLFAQSDDGSETMSLFKHLSVSHPSAISNLTFQYRMNKDIMMLTNHLVYDHRLQCGNEVIANAKLDLPYIKEWLEKSHQSILTNCRSPATCWIRKIIDPAQSVLFCDTDSLGAKESKTGPWIENQTEVYLVQQIVQALVDSGLKQEDIGVISPYRFQLKKLSKALGHLPDVELLTVDKFQGKDKQCIIISLVRSNDGNSCGDLIKDWRRVNVAITRAERKLLFVGSKQTLSASNCFKDLLALLEERLWMYSLPVGCYTFHAIDETALLATPPQKKIAVTRFGAKPPLKL